MPIATDLKVFVPARNHAESLRFYEALGWTCNWRTAGLAELELAGVRLFLQDFYVEEWAENFMIYVDVDDARAWYERAREIVESEAFPGTRARPPKAEPHGALVTYVWDPSGVLLHFAEPLPQPDEDEGGS